MSIADPIHLIVEDVASRIQRSVAVDDADLNYIAHSTQRFSDEDQIRVQSIAERRLPEPVRRYIRAIDLASLYEPKVVPAPHQHGFENDRLLVPIRAAEELIGVLWTTHHPLFSDDDKRACQLAAKRLSPLLQPVAHPSESIILERHLHNLVSDDPSIRETTAQTLIAHRLLRSNTPLAVIALGRPSSDAAEHGGQETLRSAWSRATAHLRPDMLTAHSLTHSFGLLEISAESSPTSLSESLVSVHQYVSSRLPWNSADLHIGVGSLRNLDEVHISYLEAISAVGLDEALNDSVTFWDDYPLESLLELAANTEITEARLPTVFRTILPQLNSEIIETVSLFLESAGSVSKVAREQHLHRATVYYRISQFEHATGLSLKSGRNRLLVHLGLELRRQLSR